MDDAQRFAYLVTPALAAHCLEAAENWLGKSFLKADTVKQSLLINWFNGGVQRRWAKVIAETGMPVVYLKGFTFARSLYPDPCIRTIGDIDIHVQPDSYPANRSLAVEDVFANSTLQMIVGAEVKIPCIENAMLLYLANAAKDKFGVFSVRKLVDIWMLLRSGRPIDWDVVERLAASGSFLKPTGVVSALSHRLRMLKGTVPESLCPVTSGLLARPFERLVSDYASMFATEPTAMRFFEREMLLCTEPGVALHNTGLCLKGLLRRKTGLPEGYSPLDAMGCQSSFVPLAVIASRRLSTE